MKLWSSSFESDHIIGTGNILCFCLYGAVDILHHGEHLLTGNSLDVIVRLAELPFLRLPHRSVCMCASVT